MKYSFKGNNDRFKSSKLALLGDEQQPGDSSSKVRPSKMSYRLRMKHELVGEYARWTASETEAQQYDEEGGDASNALNTS